MTIRRIPFLLTAFFMITACGHISNDVLTPNSPGTPAAVQTQQEPVTRTAVPTGTPVPAATAATPVSAAPDCLDGETSPIGMSIADGYESASYEQVMAWFCAGAEFEDILVALETEEQTGAPAGDMLEMLAEGFTWDEIWQSIGLTV